MRRGLPSARQMVAALLTVGAVTGYLLASGALDPVLSDAISALNRPPAEHPTLQIARVADWNDWQYFDNRPEWSSVRGVPAVPAPMGPTAPTRPAVAPPENPHHWMFYGPPPMPTYSLKPRPDCPQPRQPGLYVQHFRVTTGVGGATATWWDLGDPDTVNYQLTAVPEYINVGDGSRGITTIPTVQALVAAPHACKQITATITGLINGNNYQFLLEATNKSNVNNRDYEVTRGESEFVRIK